MKTPSSKQSLILLFSVIAVSFGLHAAYLSSQSIDLGTHLTWQAYLFNVLAASIILVFLLRLAKKNKSNLGFIFMAGSFLKFLVFFIFFFPEYKADGEMQTIEFSSFFIPYAICLSVKSFVLIRTLNRAD